MSTSNGNGRARLACNSQGIKALMREMLEVQSRPPGQWRLGLRLFAARMEQDLSRLQLASIFHVDHKTIGCWEHGSGKMYGDRAGYDPPDEWRPVIEAWLNTGIAPAASVLRLTKGLTKGRGQKIANKATNPLLNADVSWELARDPTVIDLCRLYLKQKADKVAESTFYDSVWTLTHFAGSFGDKPASQLRPWMLEAWLSDHPSWGPHAQHHQMAHVKACFNWAVNMQLVPANPFAAVKRRPGEPREDVKDDEFRALLRIAGTSARIGWGPRCPRPTPGARFKQMCIFLDRVGCRTCEARELRWNQINWSEAIAVQKKHKSARTARVRRDRVLYLDTVALKLLRWIHDRDPFVVKEREEGKDDAFVFLNHRGKPWTRCGPSLRLRRLRKRAGIRDQVKLYSLRHRYGTAAARVVDIVTLGRLMGHNNVATTQRYCHVDAEYLKGSVTKIAAARSARQSIRREVRS